MSDLINKKYGSLILSYYGGDKEVLHIELNEPKKKNALTDELISEFCEVLRELRNSKEIRFLVLSGSGDIFSAGGDRKRMLERSGMFAGDARDLKHQYQEGIQQIPLCLESLNIPIIARVTGPAIGAGFDLMCMADFRYAIDSSFFAES
ncbi:MAG: enoyl-CoA hydratase-related protein, partial [Bacteriovoracaceae bacterium]